MSQKPQMLSVARLLLELKIGLKCARKARTREWAKNANQSAIIIIRLKCSTRILVVCFVMATSGKEGVPEWRVWWRVKSSHGQRVENGSVEDMSQFSFRNESHWCPMTAIQVFGTVQSGGSVHGCRWPVVTWLLVGGRCLSAGGMLVRECLRTSTFICTGEGDEPQKLTTSNAR